MPSPAWSPWTSPPDSSPPTPPTPRSEPTYHLPFRSNAFAAAACAFGINHVDDPGRAISEMARVAPAVALTTWQRPERPYAPKRIVLSALERRLGLQRSPTGQLLDRLGDPVGSVPAITRLLTGAGMAARVSVVEAEVPWPGLDAYLEYRLSMPTTPDLPDSVDLAALRDEVADALASRPPEDLTWRPLLVLGIGTR